MENIQIEGHNIMMVPFQIQDKENLLKYFNRLSQESKKRYGPHPFTMEAIADIYEDDKNYRMFVAKSSDDNEIIAYTVVKLGWVDFDSERLLSYRLFLDSKDATIAPSVADHWQGKGLGSKFFKYVIDYLKIELKIKRLILWGGVQSDNEKAARLYKRFNFRHLGDFEHNGMNMDMLLEMNNYRI